MTILFIKHAENEGPGIFKQVLATVNTPSHTVEIFSHQHLPSSSEHKGVIILGGPMNVNEEAKYPFLKKEKEFISNLLKVEIPLLGICLGAQLIAQVAGGTVFRAKEKEIGWYPVTLTEEGQKDTLFQDFPTSLEVFQWHEDTFELPPQAKRLATSESCLNQGFKLGERAYGIQFHLEADAKMVCDWLDTDTEDQTLRNVPTCLKWGKKLLLNFLQIVNKG